MKDKMLPLLNSDFSFVASDWGKGYWRGYKEGVEEQRDADLVILERDYVLKEKVKPILLEALGCIVALVCIDTSDHTEPDWIKKEAQNTADKIKQILAQLDTPVSLSEANDTSGGESIKEQPDTAPACPECGRLCQQDHNSFRCDSCQRLWPLIDATQDCPSKPVPPKVEP